MSNNLINHRSLLPDNQVNIYAGVDSEVSDFLDNAGGAVDIDNSLVDSHLKSVPGLGALSAGGLSGCDFKDLRGDTHGSVGLVALVL